jgi:pyruvate/2-oxoglutarate dehydrogenase complex dihydrolipoamide dehydrogenase (E3) component
VREVVDDVDAHIAARERMDALGVTIHEHGGSARFADPHTIVTTAGLRLQAEKIIICTGGVRRRLHIPGFELTSTHSDAWRLTAVPPSMLVIGGGDTGLQVASIFNAFGSRFESDVAAVRVQQSRCPPDRTLRRRQSGLTPARRVTPTPLELSLRKLCRARFD